jgi:uncharacterized protein YjbI with pentapeptide repeats
VDPQLKEELSPALSAANDASGKVRAQHLTFILFLVYFSLIIASTTDKQLLLISPVNLPMINVKLPLREFYVLAPWILVFLHFHLLVQFYLLSQNLHCYKKLLAKVNDPEEFESWTNRLSAFSFNHLIINRQHKRIMRVVLAAIILTTVIVLPLVLLLWAQARFIPYQSEAITNAHRVVVFVDVILLWLIWPRVINPQERYIDWCKGPLWNQWRYWVVRYRTTSKQPPFNFNKVLARWRRRYNMFKSPQWGMITGLTSLAVLFSLFVIVIPNGRMEVRVSQVMPESWLYVDEKRSFVVGRGQEKKINEEFSLEGGVPNNRFFLLTHWFFDLPGQPFRQNLFIRNEVLVSGVDSVEIENSLRSGDKADRKESLKKIKGLQLQERNLRYADFKGSLLLKVNLGPEEKPSSTDENDNKSKIRGADLRGAFLREAQLQGADLSYAQLQGTDFSFAQLRRAVLEDAHLQGANFTFADLPRARLARAQLQKAYLGRAQLEGVNLQSAQMQGADLEYSLLQGADLTNAELQGASLYSAQLQGGDLWNAQLQGADLKDALLQGAVLKDARLQGADLRNALLQGANLASAQLQGANLWKVQLQGADFGGAQLKGAILMKWKSAHERQNAEQLNIKPVNELIRAQEESKDKRWYKDFVRRLKYSIGTTYFGGKDADAIQCAGDNKITECDITDAVNAWVEVSCKNLESAKGVVRNYRKSLIGKGKKYHFQYVQGLNTKNCQLTMEQKDELLKELN